MKKPNNMKNLMSILIRVFFVLALFASFLDFDTGYYQQLDIIHNSVEGYLGSYTFVVGQWFDEIFGVAKWLFLFMLIDTFTVLFRKENRKRVIIWAGSWFCLFLSVSFLLPYIAYSLFVSDNELFSSGLFFDHLTPILFNSIREWGSFFIFMSMFAASLYLVYPRFTLLSVRYMKRAFIQFYRITKKWGGTNRITKKWSGTKNATTDTKQKKVVRKGKKVNIVFSTHKINEIFPQLPVVSANKKDIDETKAMIEDQLSKFGVKGQIISIRVGPVLSVFELKLAEGVRQNKVMGLADDLALALKVESVIFGLTPEKGSISIEVPNKQRQAVPFGNVISFDMAKENQLPLYLGVDTSGEPVVENLVEMPHLLIAGATGAGKSVGINTILASVLSKKTPEQLRLLLVDPKMLELSSYNNVPHLLTDVITDPMQANLALKWAVEEMDQRYQKISEEKVRNIESYNQKVAKKDRLFYIMVVIDELADLMLTSPKEVEVSIQRLAQKARACGIHMVLATQRPSVDVITGLIKANLPTRIAFRVSSRYDSRTILDSFGSEKLLGKGDMLFLKPGRNRMQRIQGAFISDEEVNNLVQYLIEKYPEEYKNIDIQSQIEESFDTILSNDLPIQEDPSWDKAIYWAEKNKEVTPSFLHRKLKISYERAQAILQEMTKEGLLSKPNRLQVRTWIERRNDS